MRKFHLGNGWLLIVLAWFTGPASGQATATWLNPVNGNWSDGTKWSTAPAFPNNAGANTFDVIVNASGAAYAIDTTSILTVDSLTIDSATAKVRQTNGGLTLLDGLVVQSGSFLLNAGTLTTPTVSGGGTFTFDGGNGSGKILQPTAGGTLTIAAGTTIHTTTGSGTVGRADAGLTNNGVLIAETSHGLTVTGDHWVNNGTIRVEGGSLKLAGTVTTAALGAIVNTGAPGASTTLAGTLDNTAATLTLTATTGSIALDGAAKIIGGTINGAGGKGITVAGGTPTLDGVTVAGTGLTIFNSGTVNVTNGLTLSNTTVPVGDSDSFYGTLQFAGTQTLGGTGEVQFNGRGMLKPTSGTLTIGPGITVRAKGFYGIIGDVNLGLVNRGTLSVESPAQFADIGGSTFDNPGTIKVAAGSASITNLNNTGTLTLTGGNTRLLGAWHNAGTINNTSAILDLSGTFGPADVGTIVRAGTSSVNVSGTMDLGGGTLALTAATGSWTLVNNGRIKNGTITTAGGATLAFVTPATPGGTLDNVTVAADLTIPYGARVTVQNGLTLSNKSITINGTNFALTTGLTFDGTQTLGGTGEVVLPVPYTTIAPSAGTLTVGPGVTIRSTGSGGGTVGADDAPLVNQGTISSASTGASITVRGSSVTNNGTMKVSGTAGLTVFNLNNLGSVNSSGRVLILNGAWHNAGTITTTGQTTLLGGTFAAADIGTFSRTGGTLDISGQFDNTGNTLNLAARFNGPLTLSGSIKGGTIVGTAAAPLTIATTGNVPMLDGVTLDTDTTVVNSSNWRVQTGLTINAGRKLVFGTSEDLEAASDATIAGGGEIQIAASQTEITPLGHRLTIGPAITVKTTGTSGGATIGNEIAGSVVNQGTLWVNSASGYLSLVGNFTNQGTLRVDAGNLNLGGVDSLGAWGTIVRNGGAINFIGTLNNAGNTFDPTNTPVGPVNIGMGARIIGGTLASSGGVIPKVVRPTPSPANSVAFVDMTLATPLDVQTAIVGADGTLTLSGNPNVRIFGALGTSSGFSFGGGAVVNGTGTFSFETAASTDSFVRGANGLTIGPGISIRTVTGQGTVSSTGPGVTNQGTISAQANGKFLFVDGTFTNQGTVEARAGGTVYFSSPVISNLVSNILTGGNWAAYANSTLDFRGKTVTTNAANVTLDGAGSTFAAIVPIVVNAGSFAIDHGRNFTTAGPLTNSGTLRVGTGSVLTITGPLTNTGEIDGLGTIVGNVNSSGVVAPGQSPGVLNITGNFTQTAGGVLDIEIAGPVAGTGYDVLKVSGNATVAGTLEITLLNGYVPPFGTTFDFLQAGTKSVAFTQVILPPSVPWDTSALASGHLTALPEPGALLLLIAMPVLLSRGRRRRGV